MARPMVPPMRPSVASASPRSRYSRNGRSPLRVQSVPSSRDSTILVFSVDMFPPVRSLDAGGLGGLWPLARYNRCKRTHAGQALRAGFGHNKLRRMTVVRQLGRAAREEDDANELPTALAVGALFPVALFRRARADRRGERVAFGAGSLAEPAGQTHRSADGGGAAST